MAIHDHNHSQVAYLARPCQFLFNKEWIGCQPAYWTNLRFSPEVVIAMNEAVGDLKKYYHAKQIVLVGYSGGGTIAALIAARRTDVIQLITIAAVLDIKKWELEENLSPLYGSLNPADEWKKLVSIPQTHWAGGQDTVVPKEVAFSFANRFPMNKKPQVLVIPDFNHTCCWAEVKILSNGASSFSYRRHRLTEEL
jgi:pimeloyl-ACP methyl ester carboxylesterase